MQAGAGNGEWIISKMGNNGENLVKLLISTSVLTVLLLISKFQGGD